MGQEVDDAPALVGHEVDSALDETELGVAKPIPDEGVEQDTPLEVGVPQDVPVISREEQLESSAGVPSDVPLISREERLESST